MAENNDALAKANKAIEESRQRLIEKAEEIRTEFHAREDLADLGFYVILGNAKGLWAGKGTFSKEMLVDTLEKLLAQLKGPAVDPSTLS